MAERNDDQDAQDDARDQTEPERTSERTRDSDRTGKRPVAAPPELPSDVEELRAELLKAREQVTRSSKNAAEQRRRLEELEAAEAQRQEARLSEDERIKKQLNEESRKRADAEARAAEAAAQLRQTSVDRMVEREALKLDFTEPDIIPKLVDPTLIEFDDDGWPTDVKKAVKKLAEQRPSLVRPKPSGGTPVRNDRGTGRPSRTGTDDEIKDSLRATGKYAPY